jgi:type I restriction enzyme S subunit
VSDLPRGWSPTTLGVIGEYLNGRGFKRSEWRDVGRPIIRIQNLTGTGGTYNYFDGEPDSSYVAHKGDILVSWAATLGVFVWDGPEAVVNQHIFKVQSQIDPRFHRYLLESVMGDLRRQAHGSGMVHITKSRFENTPVLLPPAREQARIVAALEEQFSRLDAGVAALERFRRKLKRLRRAMLIAALNGNWPSVKLGEIAVVDSGPAFQSKFFRDGGEGIRLLRGDNIEPGRLRWVNERTWPREMLGGYEHLTVAKSDLILAMDRPIISKGLKLAPVLQSDLPALLVQRVARIRAGEAVLTSFLHLALQQPSFIPHLLTGQTGTQLPHITLRGIRSFSIPLPGIEDQYRVVAEVEHQLSRVDALTNEADLALRRSSALRASILSAAFSGKLVSQDPNDEPASILIKRIAAERTSLNGHKPIKAPSPRRRKVTA